MRAKALGILLCGCLATSALVGGAGPSSAAPPGTISTGARLGARAAAVRSWTSERRLHAASVQAAALPFSASVSDPTGDVDPGPDPRADITNASVAATATGYRLSVKVAAPTNPATDPNWQNPDTGPFWLLDTNLDGNADVIALAVADPDGALGAAMLDANTEDVLCFATSAQFTSSHTYDVTFDKTCPANVQHFQWGAFMSYQTGVSPDVESSDVAPDEPWGSAITVPLPPRSGYWMLGADGVVYSFGAAAHFPGSVPHATAMTPRRDGRGYWVVDARGHVFTYGAPYKGGAPSLAPFEIITTIAATPSNNGYWLISNRGRVFPFGDAKFLGDMSKVHLNGPVVASVATPTGHGYYMVGSDGGIFTFGDAHFHGSMGGTHLNKPIVGLSPTPNNAGYWLVGSDGGVFAFNAPFRGSMGGTHLNKPVNGLVAFGNGYLMVASDGGIFDFSNKPFFGSLVGKHLSAPIIGLAAFSS